jgi:hypothetical protein
VAKPNYEALAAANQAALAARETDLDNAGIDANTLGFGRALAKASGWKAHRYAADNDEPCECGDCLTNPYALEDNDHLRRWRRGERCEDDCEPCKRAREDRAKGYAYPGPLNNGPDASPHPYRRL